jgi:hypothetical protein
MTGQLADGMDKAVTDRIEQQVKLAFPDGAITRVQVLQYGEDPEIEPGQAAVRAFFDWPGRSGGGRADAGLTETSEEPASQPVRHAPERQLVVRIRPTKVLVAFDMTG